MLSALLLILIDENETRQNADLRSESSPRWLTRWVEVLHTEFIPFEEKPAPPSSAGKVAEIKELLEELEADVVIFDRPISLRVSATWKRSSNPR